MPVKCPKCQTENDGDSRFCKDCGAPLPQAQDSVLTKTIESPKEELTTGSTFAGRYQIIEELGKGGMGRVYKVLDIETNEKIALKLIKPEIASDKKTVERFRNELTTARKIVHKNVCRMFDLGRDKGSYYITMEYISGQDLKALVRQTGQLTVGKSISISKQICSGLAEAHSLGVVHRDLKPNNIMIDRGGNAKIMDFGIARAVKGKSITDAGVMIGTPEYMSPEQVEAKEVDQRSDIYSLGIILYEMVTGQLPFEADTPFAVGVKHKSEPPKPPKEFNPQIPDDLNRVILKCLAKEKQGRYQSAKELRSELENIEKGIPTTDRVSPKKKPLTSREITVTFGLKKLFVPVLAVLVLVAAAVIIWQVLPGKKAFQAPVIENSVAVISFENLTGEEKYDTYRRSIPNLLITNLENAGFSYVVSWERMQDLLKQTGRKETDIIESDAGFEICRREGVEALVTGSINKAGDMFAIELRILDVRTKRHIKTATSRGIGEQSIIESQIDELSRDIVQGMGIAQNKVDKSELQIAEYTTDSIEAYNYYLKGVEELFQVYLDEAQKHLEKAVEIDPTFASAYRILAIVYNQAENPKARDDAIKKAKAYSDKATEKERLFIEGTYAAFIDMDMDQSRKTLERIIEKYPKEKRAYFWTGVTYYLSGHADEAIEPFTRALELDPDYGQVLNMIAYTYADQEEYSKAIASFEKYASLYPDQANPLDSMGELYFIMGRLDDSIEKYKEALRIKPDFGSDLMLSYIYALKEDYPEAMNWIDRYISMVPSPGRKAGGYLWRGFYHYWLGNSQDCLNELLTAWDRAEQIENESLKAAIEAVRGYVYYDRGDFERSRESFQRWYDATAEQLPSFQKSLEALYILNLGFVDVKQGHIDPARSKVKHAESALSDFKLDNPENFKYRIDLLKGEIWLAEGSAHQVIANAEKIEGPLFHSLDMWSGESILYNQPSLKDVLARAYIKNGELEKAIAEYERLITFNPQQKGRYLVHPVYHYRLGVLYEEKGWEGKAIEEYEKFLELWKDANPGISEVENARKRLAELRRQ